MPLLIPTLHSACYLRRHKPVGPLRNKHVLCPPSDTSISIHDLHEIRSSEARKVTIGRVFLRVLPFSSVSIIPSMFHTQPSRNSKFSYYKEKRWRPENLQMKKCSFQNRIRFEGSSFYIVLILGLHTCLSVTACNFWNYIVFGYNSLWNTSKDMGLTFTDKITVDVAKYGEGCILKNLLNISCRISFKPLMKQGVKLNEMAKTCIKFHRENSYNTLIYCAACLRYTNTGHNFAVVEIREIILAILVQSYREITS